MAALFAGLGARVLGGTALKAPGGTAIRSLGRSQGGALATEVGQQFAQNLRVRGQRIVTNRLNNLEQRGQRFVNRRLGNVQQRNQNYQRRMDIRMSNMERRLSKLENNTRNLLR
jgi:hypothetical protein